MFLVLARRTGCAALVLGLACSGGNLGCSSEDAKPRETADQASTPPRDDGGEAGTVAVYTAVHDDGTGENQYFLRNVAGEVRLVFDAEPSLSPGADIAVWGETRADGIHVERFEVSPSTDETGRAAEALINAPAYPPRRFAFVLVDIGGGVNLTAEEARRRLFGTNPGDDSVKQYYDEVSYGTQDITGDVLGPLSYPMAGCDTRGMASTLKAGLGQYDHYLWYMGSRTTACSWSGLAESGTPDQPTNDTWYNGTAGCVVLVQEPGHNFGMTHSSSMTCGGAIFADNPDASCEHVEYGDRYDPMGGGCNHMNSLQKVYEGWLQKCNAVRVNQSGTFTLQPIEEQCSGVQVLQIPMPKIRPFTRSGGGGSATTENIQYYYLELRTLRGFDESIRVAPTVLVHVSEDFRARTERGRHNWILDMDPSTTRTIDGLNAGEGFADPAGGVRFDVVSATADGATISVTVPGTGGPTCLDDSPYDPGTPTACGGLTTGGSTPGAGGSTGAGGATSTGGAPGAGGAGTALPRMEAFTLIDAALDTEIRLVNDGETLDLDTLPAQLTLRADPSPQVVGSVAFILDGAAERVESISPYSLSSDDGRGNFAPWTLGLGTHTITATPWTGGNAGGLRGEALTVTFTLARGVVVGAGGATGAGGDPGTGAGGDPGTGAGGTPPVPGTGGDPNAGVGGATGFAGSPVGAAGFVTVPPGGGAPGFAGAPGAAGAFGVPPPGYGGAGYPPPGYGGYPPAAAGADGAESVSPPPGGEESCTCRVPGASRRATGNTGSAAMALGVLAYSAVRARRRKGRPAR